jgi:hypothetical protein
MTLGFLGLQLQEGDTYSRQAPWVLLYKVMAASKKSYTACTYVQYHVHSPGCSPEHCKHSGKWYLVATQSRAQPAYSYLMYLRRRNLLGPRSTTKSSILPTAHCSGTHYCINYYEPFSVWQLATTLFPSSYPELSHTLTHARRRSTARGPRMIPALPT